MPIYDAAVRRDAAMYARRYFAGTLTLETFLEGFGGSSDPLIQALADALIHEPRREGLAGLREWWWRSQFWQPVERLLGELDKGSEGEVPRERVYPRTTFLGLFLGAILLVWVGVSAAGSLAELLSDIQRGGALSFWTALRRALLVGALAMGTAAGLEGWMYRLRLYRTRKISVDR